MGAIDNSNLLNYRESNGTEDFTPGVNYDYDASAKEVDVHDDTTFPSGVSLQRIHVHISDKFGEEVYDTIENPSGSESADDRTTTIDVSTLDASKGLDIKATVVGDDSRYVADGIAVNIAASGSLSKWDKQKNA